MTADTPILSRPFILADVAPDGTRKRVVATPEERAALARDLDMPGIARLEAELVIRPWARHGFRVTGTVAADVTQTCVVTLEPVDQSLAETIDLKLVPASEAKRYEPKRNADGEIELDVTAEDPPDVLDGPTVDLGRIVEEHFVLGLDPYPRKPGVSFEAAIGAAKAAETEPDAPPTPFAALSRLKKD